MLETVQAGAAWPTDRVSEALLKSNMWPLCNTAVEDIWHKYWTCSHLDQCEHQAIKDSDKLKDLIDNENFSQ